MEINKSNSKIKKGISINKSKSFIERKAIVEQLKNELNREEKKIGRRKSEIG